MKNKRSENQIKMRTRSLLTLLQHFVVIFVAIKTFFYVDKVDKIFGLWLNNRRFYDQRFRRTEHYTGPPTAVDPGLGPVKNPDNTYNILNQVILHSIVTIRLNSRLCREMSASSCLRLPVMPVTGCWSWSPVDQTTGNSEMAGGRGWERCSRGAG